MKVRVGARPPARADAVGACEIEWSLGGADGNFTLIDERGARHAPGTALLWHYQHNAEYFGENLFLLVDNENRFGSGTTDDERYNSSRFVAVEIDEASMEARVAWSLDLHAYMPVFGDVDRLPSGNFLGSYYRANRKRLGRARHDDDASGGARDD